MTAADVNRCLLSCATREGWAITCYSFVALAKELLSEGYDYILSQKLVCQDAVEQFFANHRQACGANSAPTLADVVNNTHLFKVAAEVSVSKGRNCKVDEEPVVVNTPLDKRRRKH